MDIKKNDYVRIKAHDEWHDTIGICKYSDKGVASIFCVKFPTYLYHVTDENRNDIEIINGYV